MHSGSTFTHQRGVRGGAYVHGGRRGHSGALADEGPGCRGALKDVRGFEMRPEVPQRYHDL